MKLEWRRYAPLGLYLALLAALVSAGLYIVQREWNLPLQISLGLVILGLAVYAALDPAQVREAFTGRQARYGSNALVLSLAFVGILFVVNYLIYQNPKRWDLTEDKQFTLAEETINTLQALPQPVAAQAFFTPDMSPDQAEGLLDQYKFHSEGKFDYRFIDPNADPLAARQANITRDGTVVLTMGERQEAVTIMTEQELSGALVRLMGEEQAVYFLSGHSEYSPLEAGDQSYSQVKRALETKNYSVDTFSILADNKIPEDANIIVIAGPKKPLTEGEVQMIADFVAQGGSLVVMEEPLPITQFGDEPDPLATYLSETWGITLGADIVVDLTAQQPYVPFAAEYGTHAITDKLQRMGSAFPTARSVKADQQVSGVTQTELIRTANQSWGETDLESLNSGQDPSADEGADLIGPVPLAVAAENLESRARVVVFGDADFAIDANYTFLGNGDLFINTIDWAAEQENLINLTPKASTQRLLIPPQRYVMNLVFLGTVIVIPGLVVLSGISVWLNRRKRG